MVNILFHCHILGLKFFYIFSFLKCLFAFCLSLLVSRFLMHMFKFCLLLWSLVLIVVFFRYTFLFLKKFCSMKYFFILVNLFGAYYLSILFTYFKLKFFSKFILFCINYSCWHPALVSGEHISVNRLICSLINAGQSKI